MEFSPRSWRTKHKLSHASAADIIGMSKSGWADMEKFWALSYEENTKRRIKMLCDYADILLSKNAKQAASLAAKRWNEIIS